MKFNISFIFNNPDRKDKSKERNVVIEADNEILAEEWGEKQVEQWKLSGWSFSVSPFVEELKEEEVDENPIEKPQQDVKG